jgi:hypothetical protein
MGSIHATVNNNLIQTIQRIDNLNNSRPAYRGFFSNYVLSLGLLYIVFDLLWFEHIIASYPNLLCLFVAILLILIVCCSHLDLIYAIRVYVIDFVLFYILESSWARFIS